MLVKGSPEFAPQEFSLGAASAHAAVLSLLFVQRQHVEMDLCAYSARTKPGVSRS